MSLLFAKQTGTDIPCPYLKLYSIKSYIFNVLTLTVLLANSKDPDQTAALLADPCLYCLQKQAGAGIPCSYICPKLTRNSTGINLKESKSKWSRKYKLILT